MADVMTGPEHHQHRIVSILAGHRFQLENEKRLQGDIEKLFQDCKVNMEREVPLRSTPEKEYGRDGEVERGFPRELGVIDFLAESCIGIEIKIKGSAAGIQRQLARYAQDARVQALVLVTSKMVVMPSQVNGKPLTVISLGSAWL